MGAFHVDVGVAEKPDVRARFDPRGLQRHAHRGEVRLVELRVLGADELAEIARPAQHLGLGPQELAVLVGDDGLIDATLVEMAQQRLGAGQRLQPVQMVGLEIAIEEVARLGPALAEDSRKAVTQRRLDPLARLLRTPGGKAEGYQRMVQRLAHGVPIADQGVVPVIDDGAWQGDGGWTHGQSNFLSAALDARGSVYSLSGRDRL